MNKFEQVSRGAGLNWRGVQLNKLEQVGGGRTELEGGPIEQV